MSLVAKCLVELIGTFIFLSIILSSAGQPMAIGIALAAAIFFGGSISGGHFNPAVTVMDLAANGWNNTFQAGAYILVQVFAGLCALWFYRWAH